MTAALDLALDYIRRGWNPVPVEFRSKVPIGEEWQKRRIEAATAANYFNSDPRNIGVSMGPSSGGLTDVDLDCAEAIAIAPYLLPRTGAVFGRRSKRASHFLYITTLADTHDAAALGFNDPATKARLLELRIGGGGKGAQTVFPGSIHEAGEPITWEEYGEPATVDGDVLLKRCKRLAVACVIARAWPAEGGRHNAALQVGGFLARAGFGEDDAATMMQAIACAAGDEECQDRVRAVKDKIRYAAETGQGTGLPTIAELLGNKKAAQTVAGWLDYQERRWTFQGYQAAQPGQNKPSPPPRERGTAGSSSAAPPVPPAQPSNLSQIPPWPELAPEALIGLAGEVVAVVGPQTESDPVAILLQLIVYFGNAIGRGPYFQVEGDKHFTNLFAILVGESSKARKGTSASRVRQFLEVADFDWVTERTNGGLSSGEGLIWAVRDPIYKIKKGKPEIDDPGIADKRFLVDEREFFQALTVMKREGNTLSRVVRDAYDGRLILASLTKHSPARATGALVSIVGHITETELRAHLDHTSMANGYANRFLFACVRRSRLLPDGGQLDENLLQQLGARIAMALSKARMIERVTRTEEARKIWAAVYPNLSEGRPGLLGAIIGRAEAQVARLSMLYALLDGCDQIDTPHLRAALAVWAYCEASALHIFGDAVGDPVADAILSALRNIRPEGLTRTELLNLFQRNRSSAEITIALSTLLTAGKIRFERKSINGRAGEKWFAT